MLCLHGCRWDEDVYGLEYDLDLFNIVAVDDFNMGEAWKWAMYVFSGVAAVRCWLELLLWG